MCTHALGQLIILQGKQKSERKGLEFLVTVTDRLTESVWIMSLAWEHTIYQYYQLSLRWRVGEALGLLNLQQSYSTSAAHLEVQTSLVVKTLAEVRKDGQPPHLFVSLHINPFQLTEANQVCSHEDPQLLPLPLPLLPVPTVALVLHSHPQLVHLSKVQQHKIHWVTDVSCGFFTAIGKRLRTEKLVRGIHPSSHWGSYKF